MAGRSSGAIRGLIAVVVVAVVAVATGLIVRAVWHKVTDNTAQGCTFGDQRTSTDQAAVASSMVGAVIGRDLPQRAAVLVIAAGLQESKLTNIPAGQGDRDSVGVLQQRPSQGWGKPEQLADVRFATGAFLTALIKVPRWQTDPLATVIQKVQISADGTAYAQHEGTASSIVTALWGAPRGIACTFGKPAKVASVASVASQLSRDLPVHKPTTDGRSVHVSGASWRTAAWLVANADRLGIATVSYDGSTWTRSQGWHDGSAPADEVVATLGS